MGLPAVIVAPSTPTGLSPPPSSRSTPMPPPPSPGRDLRGTWCAWKTRNHLPRPSPAGILATGPPGIKTDQPGGRRGRGRVPCRRLCPGLRGLLSKGTPSWVPASDGLGFLAGSQAARPTIVRTVCFFEPVGVLGPTSGSNVPARCGLGRGRARWWRRLPEPGICPERQPPPEPAGGHGTMGPPPSPASLPIQRG